MEKFFLSTRQLKMIIQMVAYINNIYILHYKNIKAILDKSSQWKTSFKNGHKVFILK